MTAMARSYLRLLGVDDSDPSTFAFDPGESAAVVSSSVEQCSHLLCGVKLSMATWQLASPRSVTTKVARIRAAGLIAIAGGGPFEVAAASGLIDEYLDLCADVGFDRVEYGEGFAAALGNPTYLIDLAHSRGLRVQYELGGKFTGAFGASEGLRDLVQKWLSAGAEQIVVEAREDAMDVGVFGAGGKLNPRMADDLVCFAGSDLRRLQFEAPTKASQFALIEHFGPRVILSNVRLGDVLRLEVFRRGLHPQSFLRKGLRPKGVPA